MRTLLVFGREPGALRNIYASGGKGFLHDMLELPPAASTCWPTSGAEAVQATIELLLTRAPDVILELREGPADSEPRGRPTRVAEWSRLASCPP